MAVAKSSLNYTYFTKKHQAAYQFARKRNWVGEIKELFK